MTYLLGIDIGTYESKGVLTDTHGRILAQEATPGAAYGAALLAGVGVGLRPEIESVQTWLGPTEQVIQPNPLLKMCYDNYYELYQALYSQSRAVVHALDRLATNLAVKESMQ